MFIPIDLHTYRHSKKTLLFVALAVLLVVATLTLTLARGPIVRAMNALYLLPQPEPLTELYFTSAADLPTTYLPGARQKVAFTVHNLEHQPMRYTYEILQQNEAGDVSSVLATGSFQLDQGAYREENPPITYLDNGVRSRILVRLMNQGQTLHYWVVKGGQL